MMDAEEEGAKQSTAGSRNIQPNGKVVHQVDIPACTLAITTVSVCATCDCVCWWHVGERGKEAPTLARVGSVRSPWPYVCILALPDPLIFG